MTPHAGPAPFVGREQELAALRGCLDRAASGRGSMALIGGEPGIGKTRLAEEAAAQAQTRGMLVLWGRTYEGEGAPAYWPWIEVLRGLLRGADASTAQSILTDHSAEVAQLVPELERLLPAIPATPALEPAQARFRLFDAISSVLGAAARKRPVLIVLDDLHWADEPSLLLLEFLARSIGDAPLVVFGTYREAGLQRGQPLARMAGDLSRRPEVSTLLLTGLDASDVSRMIEATSGTPPTERLVQSLAEETEGNPLFLTEMVRLMAAEGRLRLDVATEDAAEIGRGRGHGVPQSVRAVIGRRLDRLSAESNRILTIAAVAGRDFGLPVLEHVAELRSDALLALLEEAEVARLIEEALSAPGRYQFTHALIREALYEDLPATRRARLHRQVGDALEVVYAADVDTHLAELAHHYAAAAAAGGLEKAAGYLKRAGDQALDVLAYEEAARIYERALALLREHPGDAEEHAELLLALGDARGRVGDRTAAAAAFNAALALAKRIRLPEQHARAALGLAGSTFVTEVVDNRAVAAALEVALSELDPADSPLRARLLARLAYASAEPHSLERTVVLLREAIAMARRLDDRAALARALMVYAGVFDMPEHAAERAEVLAELIAVAEAAGDVELQLGAYEHRLVAALERGDREAADATIAGYGRLAESLRQPLYLSTLLFWRSMRRRLEGDFVDAERLSQEALALGQRAGRPDALVLFAGQMTSLRRLQGAADAAEEPMRRLAEQFPAMYGFRFALTLRDAEGGRLEEAQRGLDALARHDFTDLPRTPIRALLLGITARTCVLLGDRERAAIVYPLLLPYADRAVVQLHGSAYQGAAALPLALLADLLGRDAEAEAHFEAALAFDQRMGARPHVAQAQCEFAAFLLFREGDLERARQLLRDARATAEVLGMAPLHERATGLLAGLAPSAGQRRAPAADGVAMAYGRAGGPIVPLTARELEVLQLLAEGHSNPEIAQRLVLSVSTVQNHLRHIYDKLDVRSRSEATAYAYQHGLAARPTGP